MPFSPAYPASTPTPTLAAAGSRSDPVARGTETTFTVHIASDPAVIKGVREYADSLHYIENTLGEYIEYSVLQVGTALAGVIVQEIGRQGLTFTGQIAGTAGWRRREATSKIGDVPIPSLDVGMYPGALEDAVENNNVRHPISYLSPIISGGGITSTGKPPASRIAFWAERKLGIRTPTRGIGGSSPGRTGARRRKRQKPDEMALPSRDPAATKAWFEAGKRKKRRGTRSPSAPFYAIYKAIMDGTEPHDFFTPATQGPKWQSVLQTAQGAMLDGITELLKPPPDLKGVVATQLVQQKTAIVKRREAELEAMFGDLLLIPKEERRARAIAVVGRRRALQRRLAL